MGEPHSTAESRGARLLVIEDHVDLAEGLARSLAMDDHEVSIANDGPHGLELMDQREFDLVVLDLNLPGMDGVEVLRRLRGKGLDIPVLILSARGEETDKILGFRAGADDYVVKPFGILELLARVQALLRRATSARPHTVSFGDVEVDLDAHVVRRCGRSVRLTPRAFDLLTALIRRRGAVATRADLLRDVWGFKRSVQTRTVDSHIAELRRELEQDPSNPRYILTVWKRGYRLKT